MTEPRVLRTASRCYRIHWARAVRDGASVLIIDSKGRQRLLVPTESRRKLWPLALLLVPPELP